LIYKRRITGYSLKVQMLNLMVSHMFMWLIKCIFAILVKTKPKSLGRKLGYKVWREEQRS